MILHCLVPGAPARADSDSLVVAAWTSWNGRSSADVERLFREAITADAGNTRAHLGLALFYTLQDRHADSWQAFRNLLKTEKNASPYLFATWFNDRFRLDAVQAGTEILDIHKDIAEDPHAEPTLRGQACESLGRYYRDHDDLSASDHWSDRCNAMLHWTLIGPFENISASGYDRSFPPEVEYDTARTYQGKNGVPARWFPIAAVRPDGWIDHLCFFAYSKAVFYANAFVHSPVKQTIHLRVGTSGSLKAFLNDEQVLACADENNNALDTYIVETELQPGWNRVLIKCGYSEISKCNFKVRITGSDGHPLEALQVSTDPHTYARKPGAAARPIENFAEAYFRDRISRYPDHYENYMLLADCYARNDKAIEAELVLREAARRLPDCPLFLNGLIEAYARGEKYDEMNQTLDRLQKIAPALPEALRHAFDRAMKSENLDEAQEVLGLMERHQPGSEMLYRSRIQYYSQRKQVEKIIEANAEAFKAFPHVWDFVYLEAVISMQTSQKMDGAIALFSNFLKHQVTSAALTNLADCYLRSGRIDRWEATFARALRQDPCSPGWYNKMADVYMALQNYPKAREALHAALAISPNCSVYWSKLGGVHRAMDNATAAGEAYRAAIVFKPTDYAAREALRELEGKRSIFQNFAAHDIDSLIAVAPPAADHPDDAGILLLDNVQRVVFERGGSMSNHEWLVKLFKPSAIDELKEYRIAYNANTQQLIVEKAVSIKKDGAEVKADVEDGYVVFKSLEPGDCIYVKWKIKDYYFGRLSDHFWDTQHFDYFYPTKLCQYALLVPQGYAFHHRTRNMADNPVVSSCDDGVLYQWSLADVPAMKYEAGMPSLADVARSLSVSSIPDWGFLAEWYADLARSKTRSSYEIREQVAQLFSRHAAATDEEKLRTVYDFITENIRYSYVSFRQSGLVPQEARDVLVNRIGDCKDVATLCIAMLNEVGINAHHVLVNTVFESENKDPLPALLFDHCIVAAETRQGVRYLDLTAHNYPMGSVPLGDIGAFALHVEPGTSSPGRLHRGNFMPAFVRRHATVVVREDNSIDVTRASTRSGSEAGSSRADYRYKGEEEQVKQLSRVLGEEFPNAKVKSLSFRDLDGPADTVRFEYRFTVADHLTESGKFTMMKLPWADALSPLEGLSYESRSHQFNYWFTCDTLVEEMRVTLPRGYAPMDLKPVTRLTSPIASYTRSLTYAKGVLTARREFVHVKQAVAPEEYRAFRQFYNSVLKEDHQQILLRKK